ncbi:CRISPR-associated helicase Cas3' [candidate division KSB1 bacterium]|nr:CRISPR-associated helicase Cas3' [candidate division KSB1 bacterium]
MKKNLNSIYAKYKNDDHYHLLIYHLIDVACVASVITDELIKQDNFNSNEKKHLVFWAGLHDIGKASLEFQKKLEYPSRYRTQSHHTLISAKVLLDKWQEKYNPQTDKGDFARCLASVIGGHHGKFIRSMDIVDLYIHDENDCWKESIDKMISILTGLFGIDFFDFPELKTKEISSFIMKLAGLITLSDWIGSMEEYFEYKKDLIPFEDYFFSAKHKAEIAVDDIFHTKIKPELNIPDKEIFKFDFRPLQEKCHAIGNSIGPPAIVFIEAPTGEGKTEAAWMLAKALMKKSGRDGCYFALPTQATSNQMYERINKDWLSRLYSENSNQMMKSILIHSAAILHEEDKAYKITTGEEENYVAEDWFKPKKRGLLAPFAVGTVDQAFLSVMQTRHFYLRLFGLSSKVVIFDEVHAYDTYMSTIFERLLQWLSEMGASVIMLSATLPISKKRSLIKAYTGTNPELDQVYPAISGASKARRYFSESFQVSELNQKTLNVKLIGFSSEDLSSVCREKLGKGGCAAVICNTVKRAQDVYSHLKNEMKGAEILLLHSRFPFSQRERLEKKVIEKFGKSGNMRPDKSVLVATQIIEQSLDLDFDFMISDLAPIDLLIQRAGRIQRHERTQPVTMKNPVLCVSLPEKNINSIESLKRAGPVYDPYILLKTYLLLKDMDKILIPNNISQLIENVYGVENYKEKKVCHLFNKLKKEKKEKYIQTKLKAELTLIFRPDEKIQNIIDQENEQLDEEDNPAVHQRIKAQTRNGLPQIRIICLHEFDNKLFFDRQGIKPVKFSESINENISKNLLKNSLQINNPILFEKIKKMEVPKEFKNNSFLKYSRICIFEQDKCEIDNQYILILDPNLGLIINKITN